MFEELDQKASQTVFAKLVGASQPAISERIKKGQLEKDGTYAEWLQVYISGLREEAAGRADVSAQNVRKRKELAQALREEFELSKDYKLIIPTEFVGPDLISLIKEIQSQIMEAGNMSVQSIESEHAIQINDDLIFGPLRSALGNIAGRASQLVASITGRPIASGASADITGGGVDRKKHKSAVAK